MLVQRTVRTLFTAAMMASLLGALGCGGLSSGDYVVYRVAFQETQLDKECYPDGEVPESIKDDSSSLRQAGTFILYVAGDDEALLDTGSLVLPGSTLGDGYAFGASDVDVEYPAGSFILDADQDGIDDAMDPAVDADKDDQEDGVDTEVDTDVDGLDDRFQDDLVDKDADGEDDRRVEVSSGLKFITSTDVTINMVVDGGTISGAVTTVRGRKCEGDKCDKDYAQTCTSSSAFKGVEIEDADVGLNSGSGPEPGAGDGRN